MEVVVIKMDGRKEKYNRKKMENALKRAGLKKGIAKIVAAVERKLSRKKEVESSFIRELLLRELQAIDAETARSFENFKKVMRAVSSGELFLENRLAQLIGKNGEIKSVYGGFHIIVTRPEGFDYTGVFNELLNANQHICIERENGKIKIIAK